MVRLCCAQCGIEYHDLRFIWEAEDSEETEDIGAELQDNASVTTTATTTDDSYLVKYKTHCDVARATGTASNITGSILPSLCHALGPVSAVAGVVGISAGAAQLKQGLSMPSGVADPHLVAKGGLTTGVGSVCMCLGAAATICPPLFFVAVGCGFTGLGVATYLDATMAGLCNECRGYNENCLDDVDDEDDDMWSVNTEDAAVRLLKDFGSEPLCTQEEHRCSKESFI